MNQFLFILLIVKRILIVGVLGELMTESPAIEFNVETNQAIGTLIGSIRDYSSNHMQPPYYVIPIQPDNQDLFNRDILIDIDTGRIISNSILASNRISQYKCSVLAINEGLATLVVINVIDTKSLNETKESEKDKNSNRSFKKDECVKLESNKAISVNNDLKTIYNCFQIEIELIDLNEISCSSKVYCTGIVSFECDQESNVNLVYLNRKRLESFQYDNSTFQPNLNRAINEFNIVRNADNRFRINFVCDRVKFEFDLNLNLLNHSINQSLNSDLYSNDDNSDSILNSYLKFNDQKNKSKILILSYQQNRSEFASCSNRSDNNISSLVEDFLNSTTLTTTTTTTTTESNDIHETTTHYKIIRIETFSQNLKICLIILSVLILSLALLLYGLFIWYKQDSSSKNETSKQFTSSSNLTYKTQTSTINSKYNENAHDDEDTSPNYFSLIVSHFQRDSTAKTTQDLNENTIKSFNSSQNNSNLLLNQTKPDSDGLFSYSNGYLAEIGINMMDNLNCLNSQTNNKSLLESANLRSVSQFWSQDQAFLNKTSLDDENFRKWCQLLGWKPEYNDISCVLNDLALLKDISN